jgi:ParB-like chromosome segregation protein Spo0J
LAAKKQAPSLRSQDYELVPIGDVQPHKRNARQGDVGAIVESIRANQFYGACVVQRSTGNILAGNHRWLAARECGLATIPVIWVDCDDAEALRILLVDNRSNDLASYNEPLLAGMLQEIQESCGTLDGTGFDLEALDDLLAGLDGSVTDGQEMPDDGIVHQSLAERFLVPPFSVLDARQGYWKDRKRAWLALGIESEIGRGKEQAQGIGE